MSLDFSQEYEAPIVTTSLTPQDDGEVSLRPRTLADYTGQEKAKPVLALVEAEEAKMDVEGLIARAIENTEKVAIRYYEPESAV